MIRDLTVGFQKAQEKFPSIIQDNYKLKEGVYIRLKLEQNWESQSAAFEQNHVTIVRKEEEPQNVELLNWFKCQDYLSSLLDMNKPVDPKKQVHSNNPFALFIKKEVFLGEKQGSKYTSQENINRYLLATGSDPVRQKWLEMIPKNKNDTDNSQFFQDSEYEVMLTYLDSYERLHLIEQIAKWYHTSFATLTEYIGQLPFKNYVKLFFTFDSPAQTFACEQMYAFEYVLYTIPKIFNSNDYNQLVAGKLVGLPNIDMTMNSKKPFMEHKTMRSQAPERVILQQAMLAKQTTEWLAAAKPPYTTNKIGYESGFVPPTGHVPPEGTFHVYMDGKYNELYGFENVPFPPTIPVQVEWLNILQLKDPAGDEKYYGTIQDAEVLQKTISSRFFRGRMNNSFILNEPDVKAREFTALMVALYLQSRQAFHDWFNKGTTVSLRGIFAKVTFRLLVEQLIHVETSRIAELADAFNLRLSIQMAIDDKGGKIMADRIKETVNSLRNKLVSEELAVCASDEEFYFMAGQLAYYLISQSRAQKITGEMYEPFLRAKNGHQLKKRLEEAYMLYKHEILSGYRRFNQAFSLVLGYVPETDNQGSVREMLLAGIFANNLLFEKTPKGEE
ncbi:hypothetical protein SPSIL_026480 [Sporomusa silvacetica DSM 10669]|uniref:CRISPR-associated protein Csh1 n=1 Tax=Sporomusa silvacetica DSM 10669 TaxID=1123289 RepID=A0ABZ3IM50_9FIRM|nr:hypothetical protein [Sporomusa silvacetica]OZC15962.1 hypothetical protein SPSIL_39760 [Sporomusa silvacetica DSM 10669]